MSFLEAKSLASAVDVAVIREADGDEAILLRPKVQGAAEVLIRITPILPDDQYLVLLYLGHNEGPIEIAGPIDVSHDPARPAGERLLQALELVAAGDAYVELDKAGDVICAAVPNLFDPLPPRHERRVVDKRRFAAWV